MVLYIKKKRDSLFMGCTINKLHTVNMPLNCSSSFTTKTQALLFAAINCAASITKVDSFIVNACEGRKAETVLVIFLVCRIRLAVFRFFDNSFSIFLRIAYYI